MTKITKLEDLKFDELQVRDILGRASIRESKSGDLTTYQELISTGVEAGIPEEYLKQEIEDYFKEKLEKSQQKEGKLEREIKEIPISLTWTNIAGRITTPIAALTYIGAGVTEIINSDLINFQESCGAIAIMHTGTIGIAYIIGRLGEYFVGEE